ncbi:MAG TPA: GAF domain-containing protein [Solirubrobacteraceae bacterium]|nr:GAF domain-containing protein [Solirubrobacteraceae bacterium]
MSEARLDSQGGALDVVRRPSRLQALATLDANAEASADALDRIARTACRVLGVPVVLVNLVGADRQRFVGCGGPEPWASMRDMPLDAGFCPFALGAETAYSLPDARADAVTAANPAVEQLGVVAYAGVPLRAAGGEPIGTLCAIDRAPREWSQDDLELLTDLAASVIAQLQLLTATTMGARRQARLRKLAAVSSALAPAAAAEDVLDEVIGAVDRRDAGAGWLLVLDEPRGQLHTVGARGTDPEGVARHADVPLDAPGLPAQVVGTGEPEFLSTREELRARADVVLDVMPGAGSAALLPLTAGDRHVGVLGVGFTGQRPFSSDDREYLAALAGISVLALERAR